MANRYWNPSGNANWGDANVWAETDGGDPTGVATPTSSDDVYFTSTNVYNCTIAALAYCKSLDFTGGTGYTGNFVFNNSLAPYGNVTFNSGMTISGTTGGIGFRASANITTNTKNIPVFVSAYSSGVTVTLQDDLTCLYISANGTQTINPNGNSVTCTGLSSQIGLNISGNFNNFNITGNNSQLCGYSFYSNFTVNGTLTINGNSGVNRLLIKSNTLGTQRTLTAATISVTNADFQDIKGDGEGSWDLSAITGGSGDCGGNSDITFTTADDWYWHVDTGNVSDYSKWYTETNGGGSQMASTRVPLPQDTLHFDSNSFDSGSKTITQNMSRIGSIDFTGATNTPTFTTSTTASVFGSITLISGMVLTSSANDYTFEGRGNYTLDSGGLTWSKKLVVSVFTGTLTLAGDLIIGGTDKELQITSGTFSAVNGGNNYNVTCGGFYNSTNATVYMGSGTWEINGRYGRWVCASGTTLYCGISTIKATGTLAVNFEFTGGSHTYYNMWNATTGAYVFNFTGNNIFNDFKIDAGRTVKFANSTTTTVNTFTALGTSGSHITLSNTSSTTHATLKKAGGGVISDCDYVDSTYLTGSPDNTWYMGANSTNTDCTNMYTSAPVTTNTTNFFHFF